MWSYRNGRPNLRIEENLVELLKKRFKKDIEYKENAELASYNYYKHKYPYLVIYNDAIEAMHLFEYNIRADSVSDYVAKPIRDEAALFYSKCQDVSKQLTRLPKISLKEVLSN